MSHHQTKQPCPLSFRSTYQIVHTTYPASVIIVNCELSIKHRVNGFIFVIFAAQIFLMASADKISVKEEQLYSVWRNHLFSNFLPSNPHPNPHS